LTPARGAPRVPGAGALERHVLQSLAHARAGRSRLERDCLTTPGFSTPTFRHFLNTLCAPAWIRYLEVGTHKGSTLVASSYDNPGLFTAVDDFSEMEHLGARAGFEAARLRFAEHCRFTLVEGDCWSGALRRRIPRRINVYFYDGPHRYEDHYRAFTRLDPVFAPTFVAVVDDWNWLGVRKATRSAFDDLGYRVLFKKALFTRLKRRSQWWNGMYVAVVAKPRVSRSN
jgi:hypothetical protein